MKQLSVADGRYDFWGEVGDRFADSKYTDKF